MDNEVAHSTPPLLFCQNAMEKENCSQFVSLFIDT